MKRKIISVILAIGIVASVTSCNLSRKFDEKKYIKYLEDELGLEEVDSDEVEELVDESDDFAFYFCANAKETRNIVWERIELEDYYPSIHSVESSITFVDGSLTDDLEVVSLLTFEEEDDAIEFVEDAEEKFDDIRDITDYYADKDHNVVVAYMEDNHDYMCFGVYRVGNRVFVMTGINDEPEYEFDDFDDVCEEYDFDIIEDLLY